MVVGLGIDTGVTADAEGVAAVAADVSLPPVEADDSPVDPEAQPEATSAIATPIIVRVEVLLDCRRNAMSTPLL